MIPKEARQDPRREKPSVLMVNLRESSQTAVLKTSACECAKEFANFCQISTKNLSDKEGAYLPGVLKEISYEIIAARKLGWDVYIHCNSGIHRAPSCAVALLLISSRTLPFDDAVQFVLNSRSSNRAT